MEMIQQELLDLSPFRKLESWGSIIDIEIYSNQKIVDYVKTWCSKSGITRPFFKRISEGLNRRKIMVGYQSKSKIRFLKDRWRDIRGKERARKLPLGLFSPTENKIAIILDENVNIFGKSIATIPHSVTHEMIHMISHQQPALFLQQLMNPYFLPYFKSFFKNMGVDISYDRDLKNTITKAFRIGESGDFYGKPKFAQLHKIWGDFLSTMLDKEEASDLTIKIFFPYFMFFTRTLKGEFKKEALRVSKYLFQAYKSCGVSDINSMPGQEPLFPSEIICLANEFNPSGEVIKLINKIRFIGA